jgi:AbrB family looped-hinge helix DNA binding protein
MTQLIKTKLSKGFQTVLPSEIREKLNAEPGDEIIWSIIGEDVYIRIKKKNTIDPIERLIGRFATKEKDDATKEIDKIVYED